MAGGQIELDYKSTRQKELEAACGDAREQKDYKNLTWAIGLRTVWVAYMW